MYRNYSYEVHKSAWGSTPIMDNKLGKIRSDGKSELSKENYSENRNIPNHQKKKLNI